jgi:hypothetical protein
VEPEDGVGGGVFLVNHAGDEGDRGMEERVKKDCTQIKNLSFRTLYSPWPRNCFFNITFSV